MDYTINEVKSLHISILDRECSDQEANDILDKFEYFRNFVDGVDVFRESRGECSLEDDPFCISLTTLEDYIKAIKKDEDSCRRMDNLQEKLKTMSHSKRFLYTEGFFTEFSKSLQIFIDDDPEGQELLQRVCRVWSTGDDRLCREILDIISDRIGVDRAVVDVYMSDNGSQIMGWFLGIFGCPDRALRTIHLVSIALNKYLEIEE